MGGVDITILYSTELIELLGLSGEYSALFTLVALMIPPVFISLAVLWGKVMDRLGRKSTLLFGCAVGIAATLMFFAGWLVVVV